MTDNRNTILAVILSGLVLIAWQYFYNMPQMERQRAQTQSQAELAKPAPQTTPGSTAPGSTTPQPGAAATPAGQPGAAAPVVSRDTAIAASPRVKIETPRVSGSIALKGARIDDLSLEKFRDTVDPKSPAIVLFSPSNTAHPYYAEFGWVAASGSTARTPDRETVWQQEGTGALSPSNPVTLKYDNGEGLTFRRTIAIDERYLFTITDDVTNVGSAPVTLYPFALISRHGTPEVSGYYILHEGLIGYLGEKGLQEHGYKSVAEAPVLGNGRRSFEFNVTNGWLGITDKYWAAALLPDTSARLKARFLAEEPGPKVRYQTDYLQDPQTIAIGGTGSANAQLFAGAKEAGVVGINFPLAGHGGYNKQLELNHFDLLIDWGWFYFLDQADVPGARLFLPPVRQFRRRHSAGDRDREAADLLPARQQVLCIDDEDEERCSRNWPRLKERFPTTAKAAAGDDGDLPRRRSTRWPVAFPLPLQIPVFFALYKVLFVTIEMRHAPFYGWINDLSARNPTICVTCSACCLSTRPTCRCSGIISRSASGRSSWASRCGSR